MISESLFRHVTAFELASKGLKIKKNSPNAAGISSKKGNPANVSARKAAPSAYIPS